MTFRKVETARQRFLRWHDDACVVHGKDVPEEDCTCGYLTAVKYLVQRVQIIQPTQEVAA